MRARSRPGPGRRPCWPRSPPSWVRRSRPTHRTLRDDPPQRPRRRPEPSSGRGRSRCGPPGPRCGPDIRSQARRWVGDAQTLAGIDGHTQVRAVADEVEAVLAEAAERWRTATADCGARRFVDALPHLEYLQRAASDLPEAARAGSVARPGPRGDREGGRGRGVRGGRTRTRTGECAARGAGRLRRPPRRDGRTGQDPDRRSAVGERCSRRPRRRHGGVGAFGHRRRDLQGEQAPTGRILAGRRPGHQHVAGGRRSAARRRAAGVRGGRDTAGQGVGRVPFRRGAPADAPGF